MVDTKESLESVRKLEQRYGIDYDVIQPRCQLGHMMERRRGRLPYYKNWKNYKCKRCKQIELQKSEFYYHCRECKQTPDGKNKGPAYDLCRACVLIKSKVLSHVDRFSIHNQGKCEMKRTDANDKEYYTCMCWNMKDGGKGCLSGYHEPVVDGVIKIKTGVQPS
jgi:hypothetical protein